MKSLHLLDNQVNAESHLSSWKVGALFMEAGTGKTRVALNLVNSTPCDLVVWIGPLQTIKHKDNVINEINKWGGFTAPVLYYGIESIQQSDRIYLELLNKIEQASNPFVVVDESLKIKNAESKRTKRLLDIGRIVEYKLILNGTPLSRNLLDLWSQMEFISPKILNMSFTQFKNTFCEYTKVTKCIGRSSYSKEYITGYDNIDYLYSLIRHYVFECNLELNISQKYNVIPYDVDSESKDEYNYLKDKYLSDEVLMWKNNNIFLEMTQKMQHTYCVTQSKFDALDYLFETVPQDNAIIFCKYIKSYEECKRRYPNAEILSYQKESFGLNMQHYRYTIYFDKIWDYALRIQSGRRTFRTGQEHDCIYYDLTGDVGLEKMIDKNIEKKISMTEYFKKVSKEQLKEEL